MTTDLFEHATIFVPQVVSVGRTLKELSLFAGSPTKAASLHITLGTKDAAGQWRTDIKDTLILLQDDLNADADHPQLRFRASMFIALMMTGKVNTDAPSTATNATTVAMLQLVGLLRQFYDAQGLSINGTIVWDAAKVLLGSELQGAPQGDGS